MSGAYKRAMATTATSLIVPPDDFNMLIKIFKRALHDTQKDTERDALRRYRDKLLQAKIVRGMK